MAEQDWIKVERTQDLVDYAYAKYENSWKESDEVTHEMLDDLYNFAMLKSKYGKNWNFKNEIADVILEDLWMKYGKYDKGKEKEKETEHDQLKVNKDDKGKGKVHDLDDVDLDALNLENIIKKLKEDFSRMLKAKKAEHDQLMVNKEVVQVSSDEDDSSDEGFFGDEDVVLFNDVKYLLTDVEIRMFKERPTRSITPIRQVASTSTRSRAPSTRSTAPTASTSTRSRALTASTSTRSRALTASTSNAQAASTSAPRG
ncbi:hypothetical protein Tco_0807181 [Tanacetum coccineum]